MSGGDKMDTGDLRTRGKAQRIKVVLGNMEPTGKAGVFEAAFWATSPEAALAGSSPERTSDMTDVFARPPRFWRCVGLG